MMKKMQASLNMILMIVIAMMINLSHQGCYGNYIYEINVFVDSGSIYQLYTALNWQASENETSIVTFSGWVLDEYEIRSLKLYVNPQVQINLISSPNEPFQFFKQTISTYQYYVWFRNVSSFQLEFKAKSALFFYMSFYVQIWPYNLENGNCNQTCSYKTYIFQLYQGSFQVFCLEPSENYFSVPPPLPCDQSAPLVQVSADFKIQKGLVSLQDHTWFYNSEEYYPQSQAKIQITNFPNSNPDDIFLLFISTSCNLVLSSQQYLFSFHQEQTYNPFFYSDPYVKKYIFKASSESFNINLSKINQHCILNMRIFKYSLKKQDGTCSYSCKSYIAKTKPNSNNTFNQLWDFNTLQCLDIDTPFIEPPKGCENEQLKKVQSSLVGYFNLIEFEQNKFIIDTKDQSTISLNFYNTHNLKYQSPYEYFLLLHFVTSFDIKIYLRKQYQSQNIVTWNKFNAGIYETFIVLKVLYDYQIYQSTYSNVHLYLNTEVKDIITFSFNSYFFNAWNVDSGYCAQICYDKINSQIENGEWTGVICGATIDPALFQSPHAQPPKGCNEAESLIEIPQSQYTIEVNGQQGNTPYLWDFSITPILEIDILGWDQSIPNQIYLLYGTSTQVINYEATLGFNSSSHENVIGISQFNAPYIKEQNSLSIIFKASASPIHINLTKIVNYSYNSLSTVLQLKLYKFNALNQNGECVSQCSTGLGAWFVDIPQQNYSLNFFNSSNYYFFSKSYFENSNYFPYYSFQNNAIGKFKGLICANELIEIQPISGCVNSSSQLQLESGISFVIRTGPRLTLNSLNSFVWNAKADQSQPLALKNWDNTTTNSDVYLLHLSSSNPLKLEKYYGYDNQTFDFSQFNDIFNSSDMINLDYNNTNLIIQTRNSSSNSILILDVYEIFVVFKSTLEILLFQMIPQQDAFYTISYNVYDFNAFGNNGICLDYCYEDLKEYYKNEVFQGVTCGQVTPQQPGFCTEVIPNCDPNQCGRNQQTKQFECSNCLNNLTLASDLRSCIECDIQNCQQCDSVILNGKNQVLCKHCLGDLVPNEDKSACIVPICSEAISQCQNCFFDDQLLNITCQKCINPYIIQNPQNCILPVCSDVLSYCQTCYLQQSIREMICSSCQDYYGFIEAKQLSGQPSRKCYACPTLHCINCGKSLVTRVSNGKLLYNNYFVCKTCQDGYTKVKITLYPYYVCVPN